jgi:hypothetical protein
MKTMIYVTVLFVGFVLGNGLMFWAGAESEHSQKTTRTMVTEILNFRPVAKTEVEELYLLYCLTQAAKTAPKELRYELIEMEKMRGWDGNEEEFQERLKKRMNFKGRDLFPTGYDEEDVMPGEPIGTRKE